MDKKKIVLLGATGSIGQQTLDILNAHKDKFELVAAAAGKNREKLEEIKKEWPDAKLSLETDNGKGHMERLLEETGYDLLVNAVVGFRGLAPTLKAISQKKDVALANKESLVTGGDLVKKALRESGTKLYPIDSEHSAIWQCLQGNERNGIRRLIITASGGSLRNRNRNELDAITPKEALAHPNWDMGARITIDSATMVNKGFEVIEAHYLFDVPYENISTVLHPESIVHSMVEYEDHATMAQMGSADMHLPIQYALFAPERPELQEAHPLDMAKTLDLHFKEMDFERYPILETAYEVGRKGGNAGAVFNGADEEAVRLFLEGKLPFLGIEDAIRHALDKIPHEPEPDYAALEKADKEARKAVREFAGV